jgi:hypothetical protein
MTCEALDPGGGSPPLLGEAGLNSNSNPAMKGLVSGRGIAEMFCAFLWELPGPETRVLRQPAGS